MKIMTLFFSVLVSLSATSLRAEEKILPPGGGHHGGSHGAGDLQGRYYGEVRFGERKEKLALQADLFLQSPDDLTQFPRLEAILKLSLGGYHSKEYAASVFKNLRYNHEDGSLTLDEPSNDLVVNAKTHVMENGVHIYGKVWSRSSAVSGTLNLMRESGKETRVARSSDVPFAPALEGQYRGKCRGSEVGVFQIQTVRGLRARDENGGNDFFDYEILARAGAPAGREKSSRWTSLGTFAGGSYDPYRGDLVFDGPSTTAIRCSRLASRLTCSYRVLDSNVRCEFTREDDQPIRGGATGARAFHLKPTEEQMRELPAAGSVPDSHLASLLEGHFAGYLYNEALDRYQAMVLRVSASVSTENPHNPNKVFVSGTSVFFFGSPSEEQFFAQRYEPRSFYLRPGFALNAPGTDSFVMIEEWKTGFVRGVLYSRAYGRVGTIELLKGEKFPPVPAGAKLLPSWQGEFSRTFNSTGVKSVRWFSLIGRRQPAERMTNTLAFGGSFQAIVGLTALQPIERGAFDPYTGALGWSFSHPEKGGLAAVSGRLADDGSLKLHWPPVPGIVMTAMPDLEFLRYQRKKH